MVNHADTLKHIENILLTDTVSQKNDQETAQSLSTLERQKISDEILTEKREQALIKTQNLEEYFRKKFQEGSIFTQPKLVFLRRKPEAKKAIDNMFVRLKEQIKSLKFIDKQATVIDKIMDDIEKLSKHPEKARKSYKKNRKLLSKIIDQNFPQFWPQYNSIRNEFNQTLEKQN